MKFKTLILSGGSLCGIISLQVLREIEKQCGMPLWEFFDLIIGASTGSIEGATIAAGGTVDEVENLYFTHGKHIFTSQYPWWRIDKKITSPWYDRNRVLGPLGDILGKYGAVKMSDLKTKFVAMTINTQTCENIRMTSYGPEYSSDNIIDCVAKSFSAVAFFGHFVDEKRRIVCEDGGEGIGNIPIIYGLSEAMKLTKPGDELEIYAVGAGFNMQNPSFEEAKKQNNIEGAWETYLGEGETLARIQARIEQVQILTEIAELNRGVKFKYFDTKISKDSNSMSGWKYMNYYKEMGKQIPVELIS
jgi:hypothetical protein